MTATGHARRGWLVAALAAATVVLLGSVLAAVAWGGASGPGAATPRTDSGSGGAGLPPNSAPSAPDLPGTVVRASLTNMGGSMMGRRTALHSGVMRLSADHTTVAHGSVSFLVTNNGSIDHELVVLPLADGQTGNRTVGADNKIDEAGSLGEASRTNGAGAGDGIRSGSSGWVTLALPPGHYELVCNLAGHYAAGMYAELTVT